MDYIQFLTIMATMLAGFGFIYKEFKSWEEDIREDIKQQSTRIDQQSIRTDQLYTMFIDLLKAKRDL